MYVGSARDLSKRWQGHRSRLRHGKHHSVYLQHAYNKYGTEAFDWSVVEYVDDLSRLISREQVWLDFFKPAYNTAKNAANPALGLKASAETIAKRVAALRGRKRAPFTAEHRARISAVKAGYKHSPEAIEKMREEKRRRFTPEYRAAWSAARMGKTLSPEHRAKISESLRGNQRAKGFKYPPEAYANRRLPRTRRVSRPS